MVIVFGIIVFLVPTFIANVLYFNGRQTTVQRVDQTCVELVLISFLGEILILSGISLGHHLSQATSQLNQKKDTHLDPSYVC
jgi:uncharacterized protein YqhQ